MKPFNIIVAIDAENGIGKDGKLPWHLKGDLKHFREVTCETIASTQQNVVIMGRKTWDSLPDQFRPLPGRINVVLTRNSGLNLSRDVLVAKDLDDAFDQLDKHPSRSYLGEIFVIGGQQVFETALQSSFCQKIYLTHILQAFECDTFFNFPSYNFKKTFVSPTFTEEAISYYFAKYVRN